MVFAMNGLAARDAAAETDQQAGAGPGHAFEESAAINAVLIVIFEDEFAHFAVEDREGRRFIPYTAN